MDAELLGRQSALAEAKLFYRVIGDENTVEELRALIEVAPNIERVLRAYMEESPEDAWWWIERSLTFRSAVLEEFERLVHEGLPVLDLPDGDEIESRPFAEAVAYAHGTLKANTRIYRTRIGNCPNVQLTVNERLTRQYYGLT